MVSEREKGGLERSSPETSGQSEACRQPFFTAHVLSLYPEMFPGPLGHSLAGKGLAEGLWTLKTLDIRDFSSDKHRSVDDTPSGGGPGMVMRADIVAKAIDAVWAALEQDYKDKKSDSALFVCDSTEALDQNEAPKIAEYSSLGIEGLEKTGESQKDLRARSYPLVYLSPRGRRFDQKEAERWRDAGGVIIVCGRFEGLDQRVIEARDIEEISLGDFILSGGETAAIAMLDAVVRLIPGIMGTEKTLDEESFSKGLLEYPHYTRPQIWEGHEIPAVLSTGHHRNIAAWRQEQAEEITRIRRPDLWSTYVRDQENGDKPRARKKKR